jgi:hypothetical protein
MGWRAARSSRRRHPARTGRELPSWQQASHWLARSPTTAGTCTRPSRRELAAWRRHSHLSTFSNWTGDGPIQPRSDGRKMIRPDAILFFCAVDRVPAAPRPHRTGSRRMSVVLPGTPRRPPVRVSDAKTNPPNAMPCNVNPSPAPGPNRIPRFPDAMPYTVRIPPPGRGPVRQTRTIHRRAFLPRPSGPIAPDATAPDAMPRNESRLPAPGPNPIPHLPDAMPYTVRLPHPGRGPARRTRALHRRTLLLRPSGPMTPHATAQDAMPCNVSRSSGRRPEPDPALPGRNALQRENAASGVRASPASSRHPPVRAPAPPIRPGSTASDSPRRNALQREARPPATFQAPTRNRQPSPHHAGPTAHIAGGTTPPPRPDLL